MCETYAIVEWTESRWTEEVEGNVLYLYWLHIKRLDTLKWHQCCAAKDDETEKGSDPAGTHLFMRRSEEGHAGNVGAQR